MKPLSTPLPSSPSCVCVCVCVPDKGHYQGVFGVLLETAGTGTHVHNSALYHRHGDLTGSRREGSFSVTNSTCRAAAV